MQNLWNWGKLHYIEGECVESSQNFAKVKTRYEDIYFSQVVIWVPMFVTSQAFRHHMPITFLRLPCQESWEIIKQSFGCKPTKNIFVNAYTRIAKKPSDLITIWASHEWKKFETKLGNHKKRTLGRQRFVQFNIYL